MASGSGSRWKPTWLTAETWDTLGATMSSKSRDRMAWRRLITASTFRFGGSSQTAHGKWSLMGAIQVRRRASGGEGSIQYPVFSFQSSVFGSWNLQAEPRSDEH